MRLNGLYVVADLAIRELADPVVNRYRKALILGSLREDVWYLDGIDVVVEHLSFSHFYKPGKPGGIIPYLWPGPRYKADLFFERAVQLYAQGQPAAGFVQLGRVVHLLTDMCCPVHAHRTVHETDPYEWYVEGNKLKLLQLPVPQVAEANKASELIEVMARYTQKHATDETNHAIGRVMKKLGKWKSLNAKEAGAQAVDLIPMCAGHSVSLLKLFLKRVGVSQQLPPIAATG